MADPSEYGSASFYLDNEEEPSLVFESHLGEVLDAQGVWREINNRVPVDKLGALAIACRAIGDEIADSTVYESRETGARSSPVGNTEHFEVVTTATGSELRRALSALADLADRAKQHDVTIWAALL